jgi:hypothetical protein
MTVIERPIPTHWDQHEQNDIQVMSLDDRLNLAKTTNKSSPVRCAREWARARPGTIRANLNLHFKGFGGGVPPNTETAAVNPRAGIE